MFGSMTGLVLRPHSVELFEARLGLGGVRMTKVVSVPIQGTEDAQIVETIRTALAQAGTKATRLAVSVPMPDVLLRSFTMPLLPKAEWNTAVRFEARKYIPFKTEELLWNYHVVEQRSAKQLAVAFVGIREQTFTQIRGWLKAVGVTPTLVEAQAVSLARAAAKAPGVSEHQFVGVVDVDLETNTAQLVIVRDQVPYFARSVHLKLDRTTPLQPSGGEAIEPEPSSVSAGDLRAEVLLSELRLSFDFFTRENPQATIQRVYLYGEQAVIGSWMPWLAEHLRCEVAFGTLPLAGGRSQPVDLRYACAIGLALRTFRRGGVRLDFPLRKPRRDDIQEKEPELSIKGRLDPKLLKAMARSAVRQAVVALVLVAGLTLIGHQQVAKAQRDFERTVRSFPDVGWGLHGQSMAELAALQEQTKKRLAVLREVIKQQVSVTEKLDALAKALPDGIWLEGLHYQAHPDQLGKVQYTLTLQGNCFLTNDGGKEFALISTFADQLKSNDRFFKGFSASQLGQIGTGGEGDRLLSYRTFELNYHSGRKL